MSVITSSLISIGKVFTSFVQNPVQNSNNPLLNDKERLSNIIKKGPSNNQQEYRDAIDMIFSDENAGFHEDFFNDNDVQRRVLKAVLREKCATDGGVSDQDSRLLQIVFNENWESKLTDKDVARLNNEFFNNGSFHGNARTILAKDHADLVNRFCLDYDVPIAEEVGGFSSSELQLIANYVESEDESHSYDARRYASELRIPTTIAEEIRPDSLETLAMFNEELGITGERINAYDPSPVTPVEGGYTSELIIHS